MSGDRRAFLAAVAGGAVLATADRMRAADEALPASQMKFGLVTYLWGQDMDLPTVIDSCERSGLGGVELRTEHKHAVEPALSKSEIGRAHV